MQKLRTIHGTWLRYNTFITDKNETINIYPYPSFGNYYYDRLPLKCYILLLGDTIKNLVEE